ncbi:MAG TPA: PAS domain-containing protein, partial [Allocoleopsis sp.]
MKEQEQLLRSIYDGINHPIFVVDVLENGRFRQIGFNRAAEMATGLKREDIVNKTLEEIFTPELAKKISQDFENCLRLGTSFSYEEYQNFQGEELWSFTTINPIKDEQGKIYRIVGTAMNITDRKKAEELLRQSEERFRGLVETINDWIWEIDGNQVYTYVSPQIESTLGYKPAEIIGKSIFDLMSNEEAKRVREILTQKISNKQNLKQIENINLHKEGYEVVMETSGVPVLDEEGNLIGYRGIDRDISDRKRQEQSLKLIVQGTASKTGAEFFRSCTQYLAQVLQVRYTFIIEHKSSNLVETLAGWNGEGFMDNFQYELPGTPCELLYKNNKQ